MKKLLFVFLASLVLFSCQKKDENANLTQDVVFSIDKIDPGNLLKSTVPPICPTDGQGNLLIPTYAMITITDGTTNPPVVYSPQVFELNGLLYTQVIKLPVGSYTVTDFLLYDVNDQLIMATPSYLGDYAEYVTKTVDFTFVVNAFEKTEIDVEVLCYLPEYHDYFGFVWFNITEIVLREFCFYGDICLKHPAEYLESLYGTHQPPLGECLIDMSALFKVHAYLGDPIIPENELPNSPFTNATIEANYGVGSPLCVQYPDDLRIDNETFTFELYILVKSGTNFIYKYFATFTSTDGGPLMDINGIPVPDMNGDKVTEFVLGSCNYSDTDVQLPPYQNLPETCTLIIGTTWAPGPVAGEYMDAIISGIGGISSGYDLYDGTWGSYCFDRLTDIYVGTPYAMDVFSSLYPGLLPTYLQDEEWDRLNWVLNHLNDYAWNWSDLQQVTWKIHNPLWSGAAYGGCSAITSVGINMYNDAVAYGDGYVPLPGGWAAVCFVPTGTPFDQENPLVQTVFVSVDP